MSAGASRRKFSRHAMRGSGRRRAPLCTRILGRIRRMRGGRREHQACDEASRILGCGPRRPHDICMQYYDRHRRRRRTSRFVRRCARCAQRGSAGSAAWLRRKARATRDRATHCARTRAAPELGPVSTCMFAAAPGPVPPYTLSEMPGTGLLGLRLPLRGAPAQEQQLIEAAALLLHLRLQQQLAPLLHH